MKPTAKTKPNHTHTEIPKRVQIAMFVAVVGGFLFVRPYFGTILFSCLVAFMFNPVYKWLLSRTKRQSVAITTTLITACLSFLLPLVLIATLTVNQANTLLSDIQNSSGGIDKQRVETITNQGTDRVNSIISAVPGGESLNVDKEKISQDIKNLTSDALNAMVSFLKSASGAMMSLITNLILTFFIVIAIWRYQTELMTFVRRLSPFHRKLTARYIERIGAMTKAMVKGQFIIAVAQGTASATSLWIVGIDYFGFFLVLLTFLSFIPLGAGIVTIPIGIILMLTGNVWQGTFVIAFHLLVVTNIDNLLRPQLVPQTARLNSALTLLAVFSGLAAFGPLGVIYGPVIMIILVTTFQMYADFNASDRKTLPQEART